MELKYYIGIDPGMKGGVAISDGYKFISAFPMPLVGKEIDVREILKSEEIGDFFAEVFIEKVGAMPKQGVASTFNFGKGYGKLMGMCETKRWRYHLVTPQAWKKDVLAGTAKDKKAAVETASRLFPDVELIPKGKKVPHDGIADALCILEWGIRNHIRRKV